MRRRNGFAGAVFGAALLCFVMGCGGDDSTSSKLKTGDLNDPEFQAAAGAFDVTELDDLAKDMFYDLSEFTQQIQTLKASGSDRDVPAGMAQQDWVITYHSDSKYWYRSFQVSEVGWVNLVDSMQFVHIDGPAQWPVPDSVTSFLMGTAHHYGEAAETLFTCNRLCSMGADFADVPTVTIDLTQTLEQHVVGLKQSGVTDLDLVASSTVTGAVINVSTDPDCPEAGEAESTVDLFVEYNTGDTVLTFSGNWHLDAAFAGDSTMVTMENGTTRWSYNEYCITTKSNTGKSLVQLLNGKE